MRIHHLALCLLAGIAVPQPAAALDPSGAAVKVTPAASAAGEVGTRILKVEGPVFMGDQVTTDRIGEAQILFRDDTKLVVGPNSRLVIDAFVYNPDQTAQQVGISAIKGTFRFISGVSRKQAYAIRTPTMSIGVRGTRFDFAVRPGGETIFALYEGGARLCDAARRCIELEGGGCKVVVAKPSGGFEGIEEQSRRSQAFKAYFPYARSQGGLLPGFRVDASGCRIARTPFDSPRETTLDQARFEHRAAPAETGSPPSLDPDGSHGGSDTGGGGGGGSPDGD